MYDLNTFFNRKCALVLLNLYIVYEPIVSVNLAVLCYGLGGMVVFMSSDGYYAFWGSFGDDASELNLLVATIFFHFFVEQFDTYYTSDPFELGWLAAVLRHCFCK